MGSVTRLTGDATPVTLDRANWAKLEFHRVLQGELWADFRDGGPMYGLISECELAGVAVSAVT